MLDGSTFEAMGCGLHLSEYSPIRHGFEATAVRIIEGLLYPLNQIKGTFHLDIPLSYSQPVPSPHNHNTLIGSYAIRIG
jgi:hypothetical protein